MSAPITSTVTIGFRAEKLFAGKLEDRRQGTVPALDVYWKIARCYPHTARVMLEAADIDELLEELDFVAFGAAAWDRLAEPETADDHALLAAAHRLRKSLRAAKRKIAGGAA